MNLIRISLVIVTKRATKLQHVAKRFSTLPPATTKMPNQRTSIITKNLELVSTIPNNILQSVDVPSKPLVILLSWLMAKQKHIHKFSTFYGELGFDTLRVNVQPWQLLWPAGGTQVVASEVLQFLETNRHYTPVLLHGFSVGAYVWGEVLAQIEQERDRYQHVIDKIVGQIWDSVADVTEIHVGLPFAVFPNNTKMQMLFRRYMNYHLRTFYNVATRHYEKSSQMFHNNMVTAPTLCLLSKTDPIGTEEANMRTRNSWEKKGMKVYWKCWEKSPHVGHFRSHPEEYRSELITFLNKVNLIQPPKNIPAKL